MTGMTNAQAALMAAATSLSGSYSVESAVTNRAERLLEWLERVSPDPSPVQDHPVPPLPSRARDVQEDDDEDTGPQDRGLPR